MSAPITDGLPMFSREEELLAVKDDLSAFKTWFGDSKVVDAEGAPLIVYHGTKNDFQKFNTPAWFTDKKHYADMFSADWGVDGARSSSSKIIESYISLKNPIYTDDWEVTESYAHNSEWVKEMKNKGYDGVIFKLDEEVEYIVFDPQQIKSAIDNNGKYDINNSDIRFNREKEDSTEFETWFSGSELINKNGSPMILFHGTNGDISAFDLDKTGESSGNEGHFGKGIYFSADSEIAGAYADEIGGNIIPVHISMKRPFRITDNLTKVAANVLNEILECNEFSAGNSGESVKDTLAFVVGNDSDVAALLTQSLQERGYDGVIFGNHREVVAFQTNQIKSAIGNNGQYDIHNEDIRFSSQTQEEREHVSVDKSAFALTPRQKMSSSISAMIDGLESAARNDGLFRIEAAAMLNDPNQNVENLASPEKTTDTEKFKNWFGDSKVLEEDGRPLIVYHGSDVDFNTFDMNKSVDGAHFFTANESHAESFGDARSFYVKIDNPLVIDQEILELAWDKEHPDGEQDDRSLLPRDFVDQFVRAAKQNGNDGLIIRDMGDRDIQSDMYLPFSPGQIKSAIGNNGEYNINNPDIRFLRDQQEKNARIYMPEANRSQLIHDLYDEARNSPEGQRLQALEAVADKHSSDRFDKLSEESLRLLKEKFIGKIEMFDHLDERQMKSFANQLFMDQARENLPEDKTIDKIGARSIYINYLNDYVNQRVPEGSPYVDSANQRRAVEDTTDFKQWFEGSQAVDSEGKPLIGFHGTNANEFTQFSVGSNRKNGSQPGRNPNHTGELGSWFALPSKYNANYEEGGAESVADGFAGGLGLDQYPDGAHIVPVYLSITNPAEFEGYEHFQEDRDEFESLSDFKQHLITAGHNGIVIRNSDTDGNDDRDDWVAFSPEQIKSAIGNNGEYNINNPDIRFSVETDSVVEIDELVTLTNSTWYYSQLERQINRAPGKMDGAPALQWAQWLEANSGKLGIKKEEIQWSGVTDWLKLQTGKILKSDISNYLHVGGIEIQEVIKVGASEREYDAAADAVNVGIRNRLPDEEMAILREIRDDLRDNLSESDETQYAKHQLLGGKNYRELLLALPNPKKSKELDLIDAQIRQLSNWPRAPGVAKKPKDQDRLDQLCQEWDAIDRVSTYQSSHWAEANVIAHIRFNDRTDDEGKKVLFIEELQSDWGQDGLKKGFNKNDEIAKIEVRKTESGYGVYVDGNIVSESILENRANEIANDRRNRGLKASTVPLAPFVTKTESWLQLSIKRMIRYAAENGYDKVAFINGEQSADRYDLSKQVSKIMVIKAGADFHIYGTDLQGNSQDFGVHSSNKLQDVVGKDLAEKIMLQETPNDVYKGNDLTVGGNGMKIFYDNIVPQTINDVLKKLGGGKITTARVHTRDPYDSGVIRLASNGSKFWLERERSGERVSKDFDSYIAADDEREALCEAESKGMTTQACFDITSQMCEQVMQGQPLFRREESVPSTVRIHSPAFQAWFEGSKIVDSNGAPLVAYHGTSADIAQFEGNEIAGWFSENPTMTGEKYTARETFDDDGTDISAPNVMPVYLRIKNPLVLDFDMNEENVVGADIYKRFGLSTEKVDPYSLGSNDFAWEVVNNNQFERAAINAGYDGIEVLEAGVKTWAIFGANQAKSAIGNHGQYNPESPDIRFFRAPVKKSTARATLKTELDTVKKLAEFFGSKVGVVRLAEQSPFKFKGVHYNGTIWLNEASTKPLHAVFGHELLHAMKQERPDLYKGLCDAVTPMLKDQGVYVEKTRLSAYSSDYVREEMIADLVGDRFTENVFWQKVASHNPSLFSGIAQYVTSKLDALRGLLAKKDATLGSGQFVTDLDAARDAIAKTVATYAKDKKNNEQRNGYFGAFESPLKKWLTPSLTKKDVSAIATKLTEHIDDGINALYCAETGKEPNYGAVFEWMTMEVPNKTHPDKVLTDLIKIAIARGDVIAEKYRHVTISTDNTVVKKDPPKKYVASNSSVIHVGEP